MEEEVDCSRELPAISPEDSVASFLKGFPLQSELRFRQRSSCVKAES